MDSRQHRKTKDFGNYNLRLWVQKLKYLWCSLCFSKLLIPKTHVSLENKRVLQFQFVLFAFSVFLCFLFLGEAPIRPPQALRKYPAAWASQLEEARPKDKNTKTAKNSKQHNLKLHMFCYGFYIRGLLNYHGHCGHHCLL